MLIGFVLIIASAMPVPVSEHIYPTESACNQMKERILKRRPQVQLECSPVYR